MASLYFTLKFVSISLILNSSSYLIEFSEAYNYRNLAFLRAILSPDSLIYAFCSYSYLERS